MWTSSYKFDCTLSREQEENKNGGNDEEVLKKHRSKSIRCDL